MTNLNNETTELTAEQLQDVSGGKFHISWSAGSRCIDIGFGDKGIWFGAAGAGWYSGSNSGRF
jgi:hypothetical protein